MGDLRENVSDVHGKFGDEFDCEEGGYFDEFGDVIDCDGASGFISDVNVAETSNGNQHEEIHLTQDTEQENEGNDLIDIDLTQEIAKLTNMILLLMIMIPLRLLTKLKLLTPMLKLSAIRVISKMVLTYLKSTNVRRGKRNPNTKRNASTT